MADTWWQCGNPDCTGFRQVWRGGELHSRRKPKACDYCGNPMYQMELHPVGTGAELKRLRKFTLHDSAGRVVSQGALNALVGQRDAAWAELARLRGQFPWEQLNAQDTELEQLRELVRLLKDDEFAARIVRRVKNAVTTYRETLAEAVDISLRGADKSREET